LVGDEILKSPDFETTQFSIDKDVDIFPRHLGWMVFTNFYIQHEHCVAFFVVDVLVSQAREGRVLRVFVHFV